MSEQNGLIIKLQQRISELEQQLAQKPKMDESNALLKNRMYATLQVVAGIHWIKDAKGVYQDCNEAMAKALGFHSPEDIIGKTDYELPWKAQAAALIENDKIVMETGKVQRGNEEEVMTSQGQLRTFMVAKAPLYDEEYHCIGTVGNSIDITEQKNVENALRQAKKAAEVASIAKSDFIANISHDLRTPLLGIMALAEKLCMSTGNLSDYSEDISHIVQSSHALHDFLEEVLHLVKAEQTSTLTKSVSFSLRHVVQQLVDLLQPSWQAKGLDWQVDIDSKVPESLWGDPMVLHRILLNLLGNAIKFTEKGNIALKITLKQQEPQQCTLVFRVSDTGIGIPKKELTNIFERFNRLHPAFQGVYPGAGLGLSIVKHLVEQLHGHIEVESQLQHGSTFTIALTFQLPQQQNTPEHYDLTHERLPYYDALHYQKSNVSTTPQSTLASDNPYSYCILLVEDHPILAKTMRLELERLGCQVTVAFNGEEALQRVKNTVFDLIFMDIGLPDIDGFTVTKRIRALANNPNSTVPIFAQTAHIGEDKRQEALAAGVNEVIIKPLTLMKAKAVLDAFLRDKKGNVPYGAVNQTATSTMFENVPLPIIDLPSAVARTGMSFEQAEALLEKLIACLPNDRNAIDKAYQARNREEARAQCHRLYGALCFTSVPRLTAALNHFHQSVKEKGFTKETADFYQRFHEEVERVIQTWQQNAKNKKEK